MTHDCLSIGFERLTLSLLHLICFPWILVARESAEAEDQLVEHLCCKNSFSSTTVTRLRLPAGPSLQLRIPNSPLEKCRVA